jgi:hypothetical protein
MQSYHHPLARSGMTAAIFFEQNRILNQTKCGTRIHILLRDKIESHELFCFVTDDSNACMVWSTVQFCVTVNTKTKNNHTIVLVPLLLSLSYFSKQLWTRKSFLLHYYYSNSVVSWQLSLSTSLDSLPTTKTFTKWATSKLPEQKWTIHIQLDIPYLCDHGGIRWMFCNEECGCLDPFTCCIEWMPTIPLRHRQM